MTRPLLPYGPATQAPLRAAQLFFVDPNVNNEGTTNPIAGSLANYPYKLPFLAHNFPVRRIRLLDATDLDVTPPVNGAVAALLTLRNAAGEILLQQVPVIEFLDNVPGLPRIRPLIFDGDMFPDPRYSFIEWMLPAQTARIAMEFLYS